MTRLALILAAAALSVAGAEGARAQASTDMSFFITSVGPGNGANLGGLEGADSHCQMLAEAAGAGDRRWRAYLSSDGADAVNARDRIGNGPWHNDQGELIARNVDELHGEENNIGKQTGLTEQGEQVNGRGDQPNMHDILTGSNPDGTVADGMTCGNWTSGDDGSAIVGHHDRVGLRDDAPSRSWNSSHPSRGCSQDALRGTGGNGLFYCFAAE